MIFEDFQIFWSAANAPLALDNNNGDLDTFIDLVIFIRSGHAGRLIHLTETLNFPLFQIETIKCKTKTGLQNVKPKINLNHNTWPTAVLCFCTAEKETEDRGFKVLKSVWKTLILLFSAYCWRADIWLVLLIIYIPIYFSVLLRPSICQLTSIPFSFCLHSLRLLTQFICVHSYGLPRVLHSCLLLFILHI